MYNAKLKEKFIAYYADTQKYVETVSRSMFEEITPLEEEWGADLYTRQRDDLQKAIDIASGVEWSTKYSPKTIFAEYIAWCDDSQHLPGVARDEIDKVNPIGTGMIKHQMVKDPQDLERNLRVIFQDIENNTVCYIYSAYVWSAFCGVERKDVPSLTEENIDFDKGLIVLDNQEFPLYEEAKPSFHAAIDLREFTFTHTSPFYIGTCSRVPGTSIMRGANGPIKLNGTEQKIRIKAQANHATFRFSYRWVQMSGVFYRMYQYEQYEGYANFRDVSAQRVDNRDYSFRVDGYNRRYVVNRISDNYLRHYERWKEVFHPESK